MRFGKWYALEDAAEYAAAGPGVYQLRIARGLLSYPRGQSAMIRYGAGPNVRELVAELAAAHRGRDFLCRFSEDLSPRESADPGGILARLLQTFETRFGTAPRLPLS